MRVFSSVDEVKNAVGDKLGPGDWLEIDQHRVNTFADATEDHQWIHVDPERAAAGPFGGPIAHGFLSLSLLAGLGFDIVRYEVPGPLVNYGLNKVRFPAPVPVGSRVRLVGEIASVEDVAHGTIVTAKYTIEIEGSERPACVAESLTLILNS